MTNKRAFRFFLILNFIFTLLLSLSILKDKKESNATDDFSKYDASIEESGMGLFEPEYYVFEMKYSLDTNEQLLSTLDESENTDEKTVENNEIKISYYSVKKGDSIYKISKKLGYDMNLLIANNPEVRSGVIRVGQKLKILSEKGIYYTVKRGDALAKISRKYNVKLKDLIATNSLSSNNLNIGQKLFIKNPDLSSVRIQKKSRSGKYDKSFFAWPIAWHGVTSSFGRKRFHPVLKRYLFHKGIDLRAKVGTRLYAAASGKVTYAGWMSGYGKLIKIKHSKGYSTRYAHLNNIYVKNGQTVTKGQLIGKTGKTGRITGPHLHFEIRKNNQPLNPIRFR